MTTKNSVSLPRRKELLFLSVEGQERVGPMSVYLSIMWSRAQTSLPMSFSNCTKELYFYIEDTISIWTYFW